MVPIFFSFFRKVKFQVGPYLLAQQTNTKMIHNNLGLLQTVTGYCGKILNRLQVEVDDIIRIIWVKTLNQKEG